LSIVFFSGVIGAIPFLTLGDMPPVDAWFEATSGITTTGFSLIDLEKAPGSLLFLRALLQWLEALAKSFS
jgi:trk system potassium uptake protein TrkH